MNYFTLEFFLYRSTYIYMDNILTKLDLTYYVDMCKNFEFNQIQYIFQNIENSNVINQSGITQNEHTALINMSRNFGSDTLNEAESIYSKYYKMKGGARKTAQEKSQTKTTYDPKNLTFEQKKQRKNRNIQKR